MSGACAQRRGTQGLVKKKTWRCRSPAGRVIMHKFGASSLAGSEITAHAADDKSRYVKLPTVGPQEIDWSIGRRIENIDRKAVRAGRVVPEDTRIGLTLARECCAQLVRRLARYRELVRLGGFRVERI